MIIGALMYDGFMDTSDGVFSARNRERMLEIMKDSHVGSNAVIALVCLVLLKVAAYSVIPPLKLSMALVAMYVCTRTFMVSYIINYKYARKNGIGHMFKAYAKPYYTYIAFCGMLGVGSSVWSAVSVYCNRGFRIVPRYCSVSQPSIRWSDR